MIILLIVTIVSVLMITKRIDIPSVILMIILYSLLLIIFNSVGKNILSISVSNVSYPGPSNLNLNGISKRVNNIGK